MGLVKVLTLADLRCPTTGKSAYVSKRRALAVIERAKQVPEWDYARHGGKPKRAYKCPHCGWWHITKQEERNAAQRAPVR